MILSTKNVFWIERGKVKVIKNVFSFQRCKEYLFTRRSQMFRLAMFGLVAAVFMMFLLDGGLWPVGVQSQQIDNYKIGEGVLETLQAEGEVNVVIAIKEPLSVAAFNSRAPQVSLATLRNDIAELQGGVLSSLEVSDYVEKFTYKAIPALALKIMTESGLAKLAENPNVVRIDLDVGGTGSLANSVPLIEADRMHALGFTGNGVVVAVLDSGLDTDHNDLADDLIHQECFLDDDGTIDGVGLCPNGSDRQSGAGAAEDGIGHGTMVTGIITSRGTVSSVGVAPNAQIVSIKVTDNTPPAGVFYFFSEIVAALDFIINNRPDVDVINMSLGTSALFAGHCDNSTAYNMAGAAAINTLRANGVITFAISHNQGSATQMTSPGCLSNVVSVGATDNSDNVWAFTNSNASLDIMAPGVNITSTGLANGIATDSGTSFASPHAAGCAALLIEAGVATTPNQIETFLESSPVQVTDPKNGLTFPRIDCFPNQPPVCDADGPYVAECQGATTTLKLDGTGSSDPDPGDTLNYAWTTSCPSGSFDDSTKDKPNLTVDSSSGFTVVCNASLTVTDIGGLSDSCSSTVTIQDTTPPSITCPSDRTIECDEPTDPSNTGSASATDTCDPNVTIIFTDIVTPGTCSDEFTITRTWTATDARGNSSSCVQTIEVVDTTPPDIQCNAPATIIPPDAPISFTATATDNCAGDPSVEIIGYDCFKSTKKDKRIDKTESCIVEVNGDTVTIVDSGGVDDNITWTVRANDNCGNVSEKKCEVIVVNPGKHKKK